MRDRRRTEFDGPLSLRGLLLLGCAAVPLLSHRAEAGNLPSGGHFVAGSGGIATSGGTVTVTQSSKRGIVDWQGFSIGKGDTVQFDNGSGATLNRVTGGSLSTIAGQLRGTGSVYLINPNGVVVGPGGKVVTGGDFVASTRNESNSQFMEGGTQSFSGGSNGAVVNDGAVVSRNGNVVLIGHAVTNSGSVDARQGTASLASGNRVLMTEANGPDGVYVAKSRSGDTTNDGQVRAAAVELAAAGGNVYALAGNRTGVIRATGTKTVDGQVWLTAPDGTVDVGGTVAAANADGSGGAITAKGAALKIENRAVLNAAGKSGHGAIETSGGKVSIGRAKVSAGQNGNWTIDPTDMTIDSATAATLSNALNSHTDETITSTGGGGSDPGDINVDAPINWGTGNTLTLSAFHSINVNAAITATGDGNVVLTTNNNMGGVSSGGTVNFLMEQSGLQIEGSTGSLTINGTSYTLIQTMTQLDSISGSGNYALAVNLDATGFGFISLGTFTGTFNGLGNTISNLTTSGPGLFTAIGGGGTVHDVGIVKVSISDSDFAVNVGGLAGSNGGTIFNAYATGVIQNGVSSFEGGLVGTNTGTIRTSFAGVTVKNCSGCDEGGLVGANSGSLTDVYAVGAVSGIAGGKEGGLVGFLTGGTITDAYSTGVATGGNAHGLIGATSGGTVTDGYWDTGTSETSSAGGTPATTAQLQSLDLTTGFANPVWGIVSGKSYPYLLSEFAAGTKPQVVSGTVYTDGGVTNAGAGITVTALANGTAVNSLLTGGTVTTGTNGYYYYLLAPGTLPANANVLTYAQNYGSGGAVSGAAVADKSDGYATHLDILGDMLHFETASTSLSTVLTDLSSAEGGNPTAFALVNTLSDIRIDAFGAFSIDAPLTPGSAIISTKGDLTIAAGGSIVASGNVTLATGGNFTNDAGALALTVAPGKRWLVYSTNPNSDSDGGLADNFVQYGATYPANPAITTSLDYGTGTAPLGSGNGFLCSVSPSPLTVTNVSKTYDGTDALPGSLTAYSLSSGIAGDVITLGGTPTGTFTSSGAGSGIDVTVNGLTVGATRGGVTVFGYTLAPVSSAGIGSIGKASLTVTANNASTTYSGVAFSGGNGVTYNGFVPGDSAAVLGGTLSFTGSSQGAINAGGYTITPSGLTSGNYNITFDTGTLTIGKASLTVTANNASATYSGTAFSGGNGVSYSGFVPGDSAAVLGGTLSFTGSSQGAVNAGAYAITPGGLTSGNYNITFDAGTLTIGKASLTVTANNTSTTYSGTAFSGGNGVTYGGFVPGDSSAVLGGTLSFTGTSQGAVNAGSYAITPSGLTSGNYNITFDTGTLTIGKASLTVTANSATTTYSGTAFSGGNGVTYSGFVGTDSATVLGGTLGFTGSSQGAVDAGAYAITPGGLTSGNYDITFAGSTLTIYPKLLTVSLAGTVEKTYDGDDRAGLAGANYTLIGVIASDSVSLNDPAGGTYDGADAGTGLAVTVTGLKLRGANAGNYVLAETSVTGDVGVIDPKLVTVGLTGTVTKNFDNTSTATLGAGNYTLTGLLPGSGVALDDPTTGAYARPQTGSGIGVTVGGLALIGADAGDYRLASTTVTADIGTIKAVPPATPFIPVATPQPPEQASIAPQVVAANVSAATHALAAPAIALPQRIKLSGCAGDDFVAVVPGEDGHVGAVVVESEGNRTVLHAAYAGCSGAAPVIASPKEVNALFGGALGARPTPPADFDLYYPSGSARLEPDALAVFDKAFAEISRRKLVDVVVTGFTDTLGPAPANDLLSLARAQAVTRLLLAHGIQPGSIATYGRGARGLQVPTGPRVAEEKNRRVEITVR